TRCLSDWSSDVCSSDLEPDLRRLLPRATDEMGVELALVTARTFVTTGQSPAGRDVMLSLLSQAQAMRPALFLLAASAAGQMGLRDRKSVVQGKRGGRGG